MSLIFFSNLIAALLEGISFALILGALSVLSSNELPFSISKLHSLNQNELFLMLMIASILCQSVRTAFSGIAIYVSTLLSLRIQQETQQTIYKTLFTLSFERINGYKIGDLVEYTKIPITIINVLMDHANRFMISLLMIGSTLVVMSILNTKLALFTLFILLFVACCHKIILRKIGKASSKLTNLLINCTKQTLESIHAIRTIHTFNRQNYAYQKIDQILRSLHSPAKKVYFWSNFIPAINELFGLILVSIILVAGIWIFPSSLPTLITFIALTHRLAIRLQMANSALGQMMSFKGSIARLEEFLSITTMQAEGMPFPGLLRSIELDSVTFHYSDTEKASIQNLSLSIPMGKTIAFVGASGAGKSTLLDLLINLYHPTSGSILIDGKDLREFSSSSWRDHLGVVSQDIALFNETIEENIRFGLLNVTSAEIVDAAKLAGLDSFIKTLPDRYQTLIGERGFRLSGGQKQRLALARALIRNPEILILDEATSSLDSQSEYFIQTAIEQLQSNQTILIVAHRLSTIRNVDHIFVLDEGTLAEEGTHESLLAQNGLYANYWERQYESSAYP